jgi:hypothetical protein
MTSCSLRRLQEFAVTHGSGGEEKAATADDEGVGTREQLVRVPIEHRGTMTSCSLRRLQENVPLQAGRTVRFDGCAAKTYPSSPFHESAHEST